MLNIVNITLKGIFRDRVFQGIVMTSLIFLIIPSVATLSMRQVTELSITLSLSLISFILLLLSIFLGGTSLWKDIDRRYTYSVLGLPMPKGVYLLGKFSGTAIFILLSAIILGTAAFVVVSYTSAAYPPDRPVAWGNMALCVLFDVMKYTLLIAIAFFFSTISTSFFLPIFGTIATFLAGGVTQQVYEYIHSAAGKNLAPLIRQAATALYFILPNFSAFDLKVNAIYGIPISIQGLLLTASYFVVYAMILLAFSITIFSRREMR
jgi:ABC-type transport system involved in multi-copper enzyme maturation permease subunit